MTAMKHDNQLDSRSTAEEQRWPSQGLRTFASLLIFIHLFAVATAMTSRATTVDTEFGTAGSELFSRMRDVPLMMDYLQLLEMDESYNYAWTQGGPMDSATRIEVELEPDDNSSEPLVVNIPEAQFWPPLRAQRHNRLSGIAAALVGNENLENVIPQALAERFVADNGAKSGTIRIIRHYPQSPLEASSLDETVSNPESDRYYETIYEARVLVNDGNVSLLKSESPGTAAPAAGGRATVPLPNGEASP